MTMIPIEQFQKEVDYCAEMTVPKRLLQAGLITEKEYHKINIAIPL
jgi:hypothetical protein